VATGGSSITAAEYYIDDTGGTAIAMSGGFGSPTTSVNATISAATLTGLTLGGHTIYVRGQDSAGNWGAFKSITLSLETITPPLPTDDLYFSTAGVTNSGPSGVGADAGDIYRWDGSAFGLPIDFLNGTNVDGFDYVSDTEFYVSFSGDVDLGGSVGIVQDEDVVHYNGGTWSVFFDGTANGLAASNIDAISVAGGVLYFSTSDTILPPLLTGVGDDADIYAWNGSTFARVFDATARGWSGNNVDGFAWAGDSNHFYLSYSPTSTAVAGLGIVQDEDVLYYNNGVWVMYFDGTAAGLTSTATDADAFDIP